MVPQFDSVQWVNITTITFGFIILITIVFMGFLLTNKHNWGAPPCSHKLGTNWPLVHSGKNGSGSLVVLASTNKFDFLWTPEVDSVELYRHCWYAKITL